MEKENVLKAPPEAKGPQESAYSSSSPQEPDQLQGKQQGQINDDSDRTHVMMKEVNQCGLNDENTATKEDDLAEAFCSLSGSYELSEWENLAQLHRHIQLSDPKVNVADEPSVVDQHDIQDSGKPLTSEEKIKQDDPAMPLKALLSYEHQSCHDHGLRGEAFDS